VIEKNEILKMAGELGLRPETVEKDYVLGWMLWGIEHHAELSSWAFKGGTSLKKCHFETYRFSEDLDFTLSDQTHLHEGFLSNAFTVITEQLSETVGIEFFKDRFTFKIVNKPNNQMSALGKIHFNGPLRRTKGVASIKLDLTTDEIQVLESVLVPVHHPYSDVPAAGIKASCYAFEEVVAEKTRALAQRARPRDLYDVVHFYRHRDMISDPSEVFSVLEKKCAYKNIPVPTYESLQKHEKLDELEPQWKHMLAHQLPSLPPMSSFWDELPAFFDWLTGNEIEQETEKIPAKNGEFVFQPDRMRNAFSIDAPLETIQFAAANRLCVALRYHGKTRTIEPLSFRRSKAGKRLFYGFEREANHVKAYELGKIESVRVTELPYIARYPVEISHSGPITMPPVRRR